MTLAQWQFLLSVLGPAVFAVMAWWVKSRINEGQQEVQQKVLEGQQKALEAQHKTQEEIALLRLDLERRLSETRMASASAEIRHQDMERRVGKLENIFDLMVRLLERVIPTSKNSTSGVS